MRIRIVTERASPRSLAFMAGRQDPPDAPRKRLALAATVLGSSMAFIDGSVVNVALPAMRTALKADAGQVQWIVNAYLLLLGALVLIGGSAGDRYGRRKVFMSGVSLFAAASLGCALAPDAGWLIAARALQGMAAAMLVPASLAILGSTFDDKERGGHAL
jgi:MFS family permease